MSSVVSSENDNTDAIISVKEIIRSDQLMPDWNRKRVAPKFSKFKPVSMQNSGNGAVWYCTVSLG